MLGNRVAVSSCFGGVGCCRMLVGPEASVCALRRAREPQTASSSGQFSAETAFGQFPRLAIMWLSFLLFAEWCDEGSCSDLSCLHSRVLADCSPTPLGRIRSQVQKKEFKPISSRASNSSSQDGEVKRRRFVQRPELPDAFDSWCWHPLDNSTWEGALNHGPAAPTHHRSPTSTFLLSR